MDFRRVALLAFGIITMRMTYVTADDNQETLESRLSHLEDKFTKMEALFEGFEQLCSTLREIKAAVVKPPPDDEKKPELAKSPVNDEGEDLEEHRQTILMESISSSGLLEDTINVSVVFRVKGKYFVTWYCSHENSSSSRLTGETHALVIGPEMTEVTATVTLDDVLSIYSLVLVVINNVNDVQLTFNTTSLSFTGTWVFPEELEYRILKYKPTMTVRGDILRSEGIHTTLEVTENVVDLIAAESYHATVNFGVVNTTSAPADFNYVFDHHENPDLTLAVKNGSVNEIEVGVSQKYAQYGGILTIRLRQEGDQGYLRGYYYGVTIRIINQEVKDLIPPGSVAIYKLDEIQYYYGQYFSFICIGVGIPLPDISIFKLKKDGTMVELSADEDLTNEPMRVKTLNFNPKSIVKPDGKYICRVSNGYRIAEVTSSVVKHEDVIFDDGKSGLTKNTTKVTRISCKASGTPTPDLEVRINDRFEDQLMNMKHKISRKANTSKVTVTISPPDPSIYSIVCVAKQKLGEFEVVEKHHRIQIKDFY